MKYIIDYIVNFFDFLGDLFQRIGLVLLNFLKIVVHAADFLFSIVNELPTIVKVIAAGLIVVCIVYIIIGRQGGDS